MALGVVTSRNSSTYRTSGRLGTADPARAVPVAEAKPGTVRTLISEDGQPPARAGMVDTDHEAEATPRIVRTPDVLGGDPRIEGHRIGVYHVYRRHVEGGETPDALAADYDLSLAEVHAALAYAFANDDEMRSIAARDRDRRESTTRVVPAEDA